MPWASNAQKFVSVNQLLPNIGPLENFIQTFLNRTHSYSDLVEKMIWQKFGFCDKTAYMTDFYAKIAGKGRLYTFDPHLNNWNPNP